MGDADGEGGTPSLRDQAAEPQGDGMQRWRLASKHAAGGRFTSGLLCAPLLCAHARTAGALTANSSMDAIPATQPSTAIE